MDPYVWQLCERGHGKRMGETNEKLLMEELLKTGACDRHRHPGIFQEISGEAFATSP